MYLLLHCHHQNDSCIKKGSDESHFNVSFIVRDKVTETVSAQTTTFEEKGEPKRIRTEVPLLTSLTPLVQIGSRALEATVQPYKCKQGDPHFPAKG